MKTLICFAVFFLLFVGLGESQPCVLSNVPVQKNFDEVKVIYYLMILLSSRVSTWLLN